MAARRAFRPSWLSPLRQVSRSLVPGAARNLQRMCDGRGVKRPLGLRLRLADVAARLPLRRAPPARISTATTARCASSRTCIAARRMRRAWCSGSIAAARCRGIAFRVAGERRGGHDRVSARARAGHRRLSRAPCAGPARGRAAGTRPDLRGRPAPSAICRPAARGGRHAPRAPGVGLSGANPDYVRATHEHLIAIGVSDPILARIAAALGLEPFPLSRNWL